MLKNTECHSAFPNGVSVWSVFNEFKGINKVNLGLASAKLERMGYIEKSIGTDEDREFYTFAISADGIDYLLENEHLIEEANKSPSPDEFDGKIPF